MGHVVVLLGVPKRRRAALQRRAIRGGWSTSRLRLEIARRYGPLRAGGRRRVVPKDETALLTQIEAMCESWRRWDAELRRLPEDGQDTPLSALPEELRRVMKRAGGSIITLRALAEEELARKVPGRRKRYVANDGSATPRSRRSKASSKTR